MIKTDSFFPGSRHCTTLKVYHLDVVCEGIAETLRAPCAQRRVCIAPGLLCWDSGSNWLSSLPLPWPDDPLLLQDLGMWACVHQPPRNPDGVLGSKADHHSLFVSWLGPGVWQSSAVPVLV